MLHLKMCTMQEKLWFYFIYLFFFFLILSFFFFFTLQYCIGFATHQLKFYSHSLK